MAKLNGYGNKRLHGLVKDIRDWFCFESGSIH